MVDTLSDVLTNHFAVPRNSNSVNASGGRVRERVAVLETAAADAAGHVYRMMRVHSSWRVSALLVAHDAVTGMSTADIGLHDVGDADDEGAVVDVDFFASAVSLISAAGFTDRTYEADATRIADAGKPLWEQLGLSEDPNKFYEITITATTNDPSVAVTIAAIVRYVGNS